MPNDLRTHAIVLRRTNYGESDRILSLLTPEGKLSVLAKGVRKEKSKLAGGIELFSVGDVVVHQGHGKLAILTSARLICFYQNILSDMTRLELASECLKRVEKAAEQADNPDYFEIVKQALAGLNQRLAPIVVKSWFSLNLAQAIGEEVNLSADVDGEDLDAGERYFWDHAESALRKNSQGQISAAEIKLARLMLTNDLSTVARVSGVGELAEAIMPIVRAYEQI